MVYTTAIGLATGQTMAIHWGNLAMTLFIVEMRVSGTESRWSVRTVVNGRERWLTLDDFATIDEAKAWAIANTGDSVTFTVRDHN